MFNKKIKKEIIIEGMMCEHCKAKVEKALSEITNVSKVKVNLQDKKATIYSKNSINEQDIKNAILQLGYKIIKIGEDK